MYSSFHSLLLITCWVGRPTSISGSCITISGNDPGSACVFPFKFRGDTITNCTTIDGDTRPWCSTQTDADGKHVSGSWGYCPDDNCSGSGSGSTDCKTTAGDHCIFPFNYKGVTYTGCAIFGASTNHQPQFTVSWCATQTWEGNVMKWGRCDATTCPMDAGETETTSPGTPIAQTDCKCGVKGSGGEDYIIGGEDTEENEYPWQVRLSVKLNARQYKLCGGTLISSTHVLTAAHCVENKETGINYHPSQIKVHLGEHNIGTTWGSDVAEVIKHSRYNSATVDNDYAILRLSQPVSFTDKVSPACLPDEREKTYIGANATATGWGTTGSGSVANTLQEADVAVISNAVCDNNYPITKNMICTVGTGEGACHGDSGGPLTVREHGRHAVIGVASFVAERCDVNFPNVFARVTEKMDWILANTWGTFSSTCKALN